VKKADFERLKAEEIERFRDPGERRDYYARWFEGEPLREPVGWEKWRIARFLELAGKLLHGLVLDAGCGSGENTVRYVQRAERVVALDLVPAAVRRAASRHAAILGCAGDCQALPLADETVDAVMSTDVIEHMPDDRAYLGEIRRVMKPGARALIATPNRDYPFLYEPVNWLLVRLRGFPRYRGSLGRGHCRLYTVEGLSALAKAVGFEVEEAHRIGGSLVALAYRLQASASAFPERARALLLGDSMSEAAGLCARSSGQAEGVSSVRRILRSVRRVYTDFTTVVLGKIAEGMCELDRRLFRRPRSTIYIVLILRKR